MSGRGRFLQRHQPAYNPGDLWLQRVARTLFSLPSFIKIAALLAALVAVPEHPGLLREATREWLFQLRGPFTAGRRA